jgi:hypothetical protein
MTVDRWIHVFAGTLIVASLLLGSAPSPLYQSPWWLAVTAFVGANLVQYGLSNFCPLGWLLRKLGVPEARLVHH